MNIIIKIGLCKNRAKLSLRNSKDQACKKHAKLYLHNSISFARLLLWSIGQKLSAIFDKWNVIG